MQSFFASIVFFEDVPELLLTDLMIRHSQIGVTKPDTSMTSNINHSTLTLKVAW